MTLYKPVLSNKFPAQVLFFAIQKLRALFLFYFSRYDTIHKSFFSNCNTNVKSICRLFIFYVTQRGAVGGSPCCFAWVKGFSHRGIKKGREGVKYYPHCGYIYKHRKCTIHPITFPLWENQQPILNHVKASSTLA